MKFTFSVPVYGDWHTFVFLKHVLASHAAAGLEGRYLVHTTKLGRRILKGKIEHELPNCQVDYIEVNPEQSYFQFSDYHQEAFESSQACMFLQADAMISANTFKGVREAVNKGFKHINVAGFNCVDDGEHVYFDERFNEWGVKHLIPTLKGNIWGRTDEMMSTQTMFFEDGPNFWIHAFHHDPIAMVNDRRGVDIRGSTLDWISPSFFKPEETAVLSGHEGLVIEISPPAKFDRHPRHTIMNATEIALQVRDKVLPSHINLFAHPVAVLGEPTKKYDALIADVLALMRNPDFYQEKKAA